MKTKLLLTGATALLPLIATAATIDRATLTEVVNTVSVIDRATKKSSAAQKQQIFEAPNVLRTGPNSRAEMVAADQTVTRVGQNTLFSFKQESREINLEKGSILFQSPNGQGGGTIRTSAASAAVLGTTLIVTATSNGGFKVLLLEGKGRISGPGGTRTLTAGQLAYAMPGGQISNVFNFQLREQAGASKLVRGFKRPLPSLGKIAAAIESQEKEIKTGKVIATGLLASGSPDYAYQIDVGRDAQINGGEEIENKALSPFQAAVSSNATISVPKLDAARLFGPGLNTNEFPSPPILLGDFGGQRFRAASSPAVFLGNNISFETTSVDLSPLAGRDLVQFFATSDLAIKQSFDFSSFAGQLFISAGGAIRNEPGITVRASSSVLALLAFGNAKPFTDMPSGIDDVRLQKTTTLDQFNLVNSTGGIFVGGGNLELRAFQSLAPRAIELNASGSLSLDRTNGAPNVSLFTLMTNDGPLPAGYSNLASDTTFRVSADGNASIRNTSIRAPRIAMNAANITLERVRLNDGSSVDTNTPRGQMPLAATVRLNAENLLAVSGVRFAANDIYMQARTISLADVNFRAGSRVWLESGLGILAPNPNTNSPVLPNYVNFVRNVRYAGNAITSPADNVILQNGLPSSGATPQTPGIVIRPRR
jgi:hypothetical protein